MLSKTAASKIGHVIISASTITQKIQKATEHIEKQLLHRINKSPWYMLQVDESTDVENKAAFLVYM